MQIFVCILTGHNDFNIVFDPLSESDARVTTPLYLHCLLFGWGGFFVCKPLEK